MCLGLFERSLSHLEEDSLMLESLEFSPTVCLSLTTLLHCKRDKNKSLAQFIGNHELPTMPLMTQWLREKWPRLERLKRPRQWRLEFLSFFPRVQIPKSKRIWTFNLSCFWRPELFVPLSLRIPVVLLNLRKFLSHRCSICIMQTLHFIQSESTGIVLLPVFYLLLLNTKWNKMKNWRLKKDCWYFESCLQVMFLKWHPLPAPSSQDQRLHTHWSCDWVWTICKRTQVREGSSSFM